jgi:hypothetical protein
MPLQQPATGLVSNVMVWLTYYIWVDFPPCWDPLFDIPPVISHLINLATFVAVLHLFVL